MSLLLPIRLPFILNDCDFSEDWIAPDSALHLDFANNRAALHGQIRSLSDLIECGRASAAWAVDGSGRVHEFDAYEPRLTDRGLLVFQSDENGLPPDPRDLSNRVNVEFEAGYLAPDGSQNAVLVRKTEAHSYIFSTSWDYSSVWARLPAGKSGTIAVACHNSGTQTELTDQWQLVELGRAERGANDHLYYAVDFRGSDVDEVILWAVKASNVPAGPPILAQGVVAADDVRLSDEALSTSYNLGPELVINAQFENAAGWEQKPGWSIIDGSAIYDGSMPGYYQTIPQDVAVEPGKTYQAIMIVEEITGGSANLRVVNDGNFEQKTIHAAGLCVVTFTAQSGSVEIAGQANKSPHQIRLSRLSLREVIPVDFTMIVDFTTSADWGGRTSAVLSSSLADVVLPHQHTAAGDKRLISFDGDIWAIHGVLEPSTRYKIAIVIKGDGSGLLSSINGQAGVASAADLSKAGIGDIFLGSFKGNRWFLGERIHDFQIIEGALSDAELIERSAL